MSGGLEQLVYASVSVMGSTSVLQVSDILAQSRRNNARDDITGALALVGGRFLQIVEGPSDNLKPLIARLRTDIRHRDMLILERRPISRRDFRDWSMVSPRLMAEETATLASLLAAHQIHLDALVPVLLQAVMRQATMTDGAYGPHETDETGTPEATPPPGPVAPGPSRHI